MKTEEEIKSIAHEIDTREYSYNEGNSMKNYSNTTEDEISKLADSADFEVQEKLVQQYKHVAGIKSFLESLDFVGPGTKNFNPIYFAASLFDDEYKLFRATCPKMWKEIQDVLAKKMAEYNKLEAEREVAKAKMPWYKRIFA